jgi:hypothetical protein
MRKCQGRTNYVNPVAHPDEIKVMNMKDRLPGHRPGLYRLYDLILSSIHHLE